MKRFSNPAIPPGALDGLLRQVRTVRVHFTDQMTPEEHRQAQQLEHRLKQGSHSGAAPCKGAANH